MHMRSGLAGLLIIDLSSLTSQQEVVQAEMLTCTTATNQYLLSCSDCTSSDAVSHTSSTKDTFFQDRKCI